MQIQDRATYQKAILSIVIAIAVSPTCSFVRAEDSAALFDPAYGTVKSRVSHVLAHGIKVIRGKTEVIIPQHKSFCPAGNIFKFNTGDILVWANAGGDGQVSSKRSSDNGKTWHEVAGSFDDSAYQYPEPDGEVVMFNRIPSALELKAGQTGVYDAFFSRSQDQGLTRVKDTATITLPEEFHGWNVYPRRRIVGLSDGSLLMSIYCKDMAERETAHKTKYRSIVIRSADRGKSWQYLATIAFDMTEENPEASSQGILPVGRYEGFCEPCLLTLPNDKVFCFLRSGANYRMSISDPRGQTPLYMTISNDAGRTWSNADPVAPFGVYPGALVMQNGIMVASYGRPGNWLMFSKDQGKNWGPIIPFYHDLYPPDCSNYISMVEVDMNILLVVYARTDPNDPWKSEIVGTYFHVQRTEP